MDVGSALTVVGLAVAWLLYQLQRAADREGQVGAALALLRAVEGGLTDKDAWGYIFFENEWVGKALDIRAGNDRRAVLNGGWNQVFEVPTEPLASLIQSPTVGDLIHRDTIRAANMAMFKIGALNQLVRQQTDLYSRYIPEIVDPNLPQNRREALAVAAEQQSRMLHGDGIGRARAEGEWYADLKKVVASNIESLDEQAKSWRSWGVYLAVAFVVVTAAGAVWVAYDAETSSDPVTAVLKAQPASLTFRAAGALRASWWQSTGR